MKKLFFYSLFCLLPGVFFSCSKPNYNADPGSVSNNSNDPLNKTFPSFNWSGTGAPISAVINGNSWQADAGSISYNYSGGYFILSGNSGGHQTMGIWLYGAAAGHSYWLGYNNGAQYIGYTDSVSVPAKYWYWSYNTSLYGTGAVEVTRNDTIPGTSAFLQGKFLFEGIDGVGRIINVTNGYFNIQKW